MNSLRYDPAQIIWQEGIYRSGCFIICEGTADLVVRNFEGRRRIILSLQAGDFIPCLDGLQVSDSTHDFATQAESTSPVLVHYLPSDCFGYLLIRYPSIATKVLEKLSGVVLHLIREVGVSSYCDVQARVARILCFLQEAGQLKQPPSQQVMADLVGASREAVNKALHHLIHEKMIAIQDRKIEILDERGLKQLQV